MSAQEALSEYMRDSMPEPDREHYRIGDHGHELNEADWAMRKLAHLRGQQADVQRAGQAEIERIKAWMAGEVQRFENDAVYFQELLVSWHQSRMADAFEEAGGDWGKVKGKSARLPSGQVRARQLPDRVEVDESLLPASDQFWHIKREPDKRYILASIKQTGEIPAGVTYVTGDVSFSVVVGSEAHRSDMEE